MRACFAIFLILFISYSVCNSQSRIKTDSLRIKYLQQNRFDSALYYAEEVAALLRGSVGENNIEFANTLNNLAVSHFYFGNFSKAKYYALKEIELRENLLATKDANYIRSLENASIICRKFGSYEEALILIKKTKKNALKIYGQGSSEYANVLCSYAGAYNDIGCSINDLIFLKKADDFFIQAENIYKKNGINSLKAEIVNKANRASYNNNSGNYPLAESLFLEVVSLCENEYGNSSLYYATAMNNLAVFYYNLGNFKQAEKYFVEAVDIYNKSALSTSIQSGICINNLGALYNDIGNYEIAIKLLSESREIFEKNYQIHHPAYAVVLNNQASVNLIKEYYASSEDKNNETLLSTGKMFFKADSIFEVNCKNPNPDRFIITSNLSLWYKMSGDTTKSLQTIYDGVMQSNINVLKAISLINKMSLSSLIPKQENQDAHSIIEPIMIAIKINLTDLMINERGIEDNINNRLVSTKLIIKLLFGKSNNIKKTLGPYHPVYATVLKMMSMMYMSIGDAHTEEVLVLDYMKIINHNTLQDFTFLSESEKELYYKTRLPDIHSFIAYTLNRKERNPKITCSAYNVILQNKGLMLKSSTAMRLAILNSKDSVLLIKYDEWLSLQKDISVQYSTPVEMRTKNVTVLENKANALEKSLVQSSQIFGDYRKGIQITWKDVSDSLKTDEAAIEFTHFKFKEKNGGKKVYYCALIVRSDSKYPEMVKLFEEKELEAIIGKTGENNINYINNVYGTENNPDDRLYNLIWKSLEENLKDIKTVYLSPSGLLHKVSFAALCKEQNVYLCDNYNIEVKSSTGKITAHPPTLPNSRDRLSQREGEQELKGQPNSLSFGECWGEASLFGGITYDTDSTENNSDSYRGWNYLEGTKTETEKINQILEKGKIIVNYFSNITATEEEFKFIASKSNILHIATHGFFYPDPKEVEKEVEKEIEHGAIAFRGGSRGFGVSSFINNENSLMRSGLVFAGANDVWSKQENTNRDDGVLTAQEVAHIDMRKTNLVVMSACETGLGDIKGSEGVYGLQRAFKMAGVKYLIMSLWQVPDKETEEFMTTFYTKLLKLKDIKQAFNQTQKEMRDKYDPYFWAAFVLIE